MTDPAHPTGEAPHGEHQLDSPVSLPPGPSERRNGWRWTTVAIATATLALAAFDAPALQGWFDELPASPLTEPLRAPIARLDAATAAAGIDRPVRWLHDRWQALRAARFGGEESGEHGEDAGS